MPLLGNIGSSELVIILLVLVVVFGSQRISDLAKGLGETSKEVKKIRKDFDDALDDATEDVKKVAEVALSEEKEVDK